MMRTPTVLQMEAAECGSVALAIIMRHYGCYVSLEKLRAQCGVSRDGSKAVNMLRVARQYGFNAQGAQVENLEDLKEIKFPCILYWEFNHFVVLDGIKEKNYYINDPATGPRIVSHDEFDKAFTGVVLVFNPTEKFITRGEKPSTVKALFKRLHGSRLSLLYIILASLALVIPGIIIPGFSKIFIDDILIRGVQGWFTPLLLGMLLTAAMRGILTWLQQTYLVRLQIKLMLTGSARFLWHVMTLPLTFFQQRFTGDIQERVAANNRVAELLSSDLTSSVISLIAIAFYAFVLVLLEWKLACIVILLATISFFTLYLIARKIADISRRFLQERGRLTGVEMNGLQIIETLKAMGLEDDFFKRWSGYHAKTINSQQKIMTYNQVLLILPQLLSGLTTVIILSFGGWQVMQGVLTVGTLVAIQSLAVTFNAPLIALLGLGNQIQQIRGDLARLDDVLQHPTDQRLLVSEKKSEQTAEKLKGQIELSNVTFGYSIQEEPFIKNINLVIKPGERVAIVGQSGSGKSTLIRLICGLYQPWSGEIKFDNRPLTMISQEQIARSLSMVDQDIFLFNGNIIDNLTLWNNQYTADNIQHALEDACIVNEVMERGGLLSAVSEAGANFSGGQRQRLEIARALVNQPNILILDEATAQLDPIIENKIYNHLKQKNHTLLIVAHRLSAIRDCDKIIVLDKGKIAEHGTHDELIQNGSEYKKLINGTSG